MMLPYDLTTRENMILYFSLKNKKGYSLKNREYTIQLIANDLKKYVNNFDYIIIPESTSDFLELVIKQFKKPYMILYKNNIEYFKNLALSLGLQKSELKSHLRRMDEMGETFKINMLKPNQRKYYVNYLFQNFHAPKNSIIIDDSNFTGTTAKALQYSTGINSYLPIFSKEPI